MLDDPKLIKAQKHLNSALEILGGKIEFASCSDRTTEHKKITITYDKEKKL
jgi:hypothetical protein